MFLIRQCKSRFWVPSKIVISCLFLLSESAWSQVVPDGTTSTSISGDCTPICTITEGTTDLTRRNLFHSFEQFSIPTNGGVFFESSPTVRNILGRITGNFRSEIDGLVSANHTANLFLLNPQGFLFGPNARLDIGGSFIATTSDAIQFHDQGVFSAFETDNNLALLTIDPSAFLFNQITTQPIINQSLLGLEVRDGRSLSLLGGDVRLEPSVPFIPIGGRLNAPGGRIEVGGVASTGIVELTMDGNNLRLNYDDNTVLADVSLNSSFLNVNSGIDAGSIAINASSFSLINSAISSETIGEENAGDINIFTRANGSVSLEKSTISSLTSGEGNGGNLNVKTGLLRLNDNSGLLASTQRRGNAGRIFVEADVVSLNNNSSIVSEAESLASVLIGDAGDIELQTDSLSLTNGSRISTLTVGDAVNVESGGSLIISGHSISLTGGSFIVSETLGQANASDIQITASELVVHESF